MADPKYPNESSEYRQAREALLEEEIALIDRPGQGRGGKTTAIADGRESQRRLPVRRR